MGWSILFILPWEYKFNFQKKKYTREFVTGTMRNKAGSCLPIKRLKALYVKTHSNALLNKTAILFTDLHYDE
jgi:hypothetical protein